MINGHGDLSFIVASGQARAGCDRNRQNARKIEEIKRTSRTHTQRTQ